jgi:hypothetical protein
MKRDNRISFARYKKWKFMTCNECEIKYMKNDREMRGGGFL